MKSSKVIQRNSSSKVYGYWKQIAGKALEESVNPVGGTTSLRTSQVHDMNPRGLTQDTHNYYGGTHNSTPGPGSYPIDRTTGASVGSVATSKRLLIANPFSRRFASPPLAHRRARETADEKNGEGGIHRNNGDSREGLLVAVRCVRASER